MSCRFGYYEFNFGLGIPLDYLIHGFGRWSRVYGVYFPGVGSKGPALLRFHVIKNK
jgi:hypothetical protein